MITIQTDTLRYSVDGKGFVREFANRANSINHAVAGSYAFYLLDDSDELTPPESVASEDGLLAVRFPGVRFTLAAVAKSRHIRFTIVDQKPLDAPFGRFVFAAVQTDDRDGGSDFSGSARSLCLKCNMLELPGRCERIGSVAYAALGAVGVSSALVGAPRAELVQALDEAVAHLTIDDIPLSPYGGQHGAEAPGSHSDYVIVSKVDCAEDADWLKTVRRLNVRQVDFHQGGMYRQADYQFLPDLFPNGAADFRRKVADFLHAQGLQAGLHTYSGMVDVKSRYVTPVPSKDLHALAVYALARDLGEDDDTLFVAGGSESVAEIQGPHADVNVTCLMIDEEIVAFHGKGPDGALTKLERGALGTRKAPHAAGAAVRHLRNMYGYFQSEPGSALFYQLAKNQATTFNDGGFDSMYFDGLECIGDCCSEPGTVDAERKKGLGWYYEALFVREVLRHCNRKAIVEYSTMHPQLWAARSRAGAFDFPNSGYKQFYDIHCRSNEADSHRRLLPSQLGWIMLYPPLWGPKQPCRNWITKYPFDDDIDYLGTKAIAFDSGFSYMLPASRQLEDCPAMGRFADKLARYSRVRETHRFPPGLLEKLKAYKTGFQLVDADANPGFERLERLLARPYSFAPGENTCTVVNPFAAQKPRIRIVGECCQDASGALRRLLSFDRERPANEQRLLYEYPQDEPLNIGESPALGLWVMGNGRDEYLNVRLEGMYPWGVGFGDHVIFLNFTGWRHFSLCEIDNGDYADMRFRNDIFDVDRHDSLYRRYRNPFSYEGIARIRFLFTEGGDGVRLGELTAGPASATPISNPTVQTDGGTLSFRCDLPPGNYLEYDPETGTACLYDHLGFSKEVGVSGSAALAAGKNTVSFAGEADGTRRVKVHFLVRGETLRD